MPRSMFAGGTDYSHQSFDDMVYDLKEWLEGVQATIKELKSIRQSIGSALWTSFDYDMRLYFERAVRFFETCEIELSEISEEVQVEVLDHHISRLLKLDTIADELNNDIGSTWNNLDWSLKQIGGPDAYYHFESYYVCAREMAVDLTDIENLASRLSDFIGRKSVSSHERQWDILYLGAEPKDESPLRLGEEYREIQRCIQAAPERDRLSLHAVTSTRPLDLTDALLRHKPQIVHFAGHGSSYGEIGLEDRDGYFLPVDIESFGNLFKRFSASLRCVVLNACYSEFQARVISNYVPNVIGMKTAMLDDAAIAFSVGFYQALGAGQSIEDSYEFGRLQMSLMGFTKHAEAVVLYRK